MKSLILKDLYNVGHNVKSMLLILAVMAAAFLPTSGVTAYLFICAFLCSMMIITTFSLDDTAKWNRYAMIMPISRKDLVISKFIVLAIFSAAGSLFGLIVSVIVETADPEKTFNISRLGEMLFFALAAWTFSLILEGIAIPLAFKFGAEKGRILLLVSSLIPLTICYLAYRLLLMLGVQITDHLLFVLLCWSPVIALLWCLIMCKISYQIFAKKEL